MKKIVFFLLFILTGSIVVFAQTDSANSTAKFQKLPSFSVSIVPDSLLYTNKNLKAGKPLVIMFFSPDCEHCQKETKEILAYKNELKNVPMLMLSPASYQQIKNFYVEYGLADMPNIKMAEDKNYALGSIYKLRTFPSIFVYDSTGNLAKAFVGNIGIPAILDALK